MALAPRRQGEEVSMSEPSATAMQQAYQALKNVPLGEWWYAAVLKKAHEIDTSAATCAENEEK